MLSKKTIASKLTECGLKKKHVALLVREYELTLAPLFLQAAALRGKIELPPQEETSPKYRMPPPVFPEEAEKTLLPLVRVSDGKLVVEADPLPGGFVDRWEKVASMGASMPPSIWERHLGLSPEQLVNIDCDDMTRKYLKESWRTATVRYRDERWASALTTNPFFFDLAFQMFVRLPVETAERLVLQMIAANHGTWRLKDANDSVHQVMMFTIRGLSWDWSEEFAASLLPHLQREVDEPLPEISQWLLYDAAIFFPVSMQPLFPDAVRCGGVLKLKEEIYSVL